MKLFARFLNFFLFISFIGLNSCGSDDPKPKLAAIEITASAGTKVDLGATTVLTATGTDTKGNEYDISGSLEWTASNDNISLDQAGKVTGLTVGTTFVKAAAEGVTQNITIRVWDSSAPRVEIYVSDAGNFNNPPWQILKYEEDGKFPEVFTNTNLGWPQDILILEDQEIMLVSNLNDGNIVKFNINTGASAGTFANGISGPTRMKIGPDKLLYVLQWQGNGLVKRYELNGTFVDNFTKVGVNESIGLAWDTGGNLYVSSFNGGAGGYVRKFDTEGNDLGKFIDSGLMGPTNIWFDGAGNMLVNDWQGGAIRKYNSEGQSLGTVVSGLSQVEGIDFLNNGNWLVGNGGTAAVKEFTSSGTFVKDLITSQSGGLIKPNAVVLRRVNY